MLTSHRIRPVSMQRFQPEYVRPGAGRGGDVGVGRGQQQFPRRRSRRGRLPPPEVVGTGTPWGGSCGWREAVALSGWGAVAVARRRELALVTSSARRLPTPQAGTWGPRAGVGTELSS